MPFFVAPPRSKSCRSSDWACARLTGPSRAAIAATIATRRVNTSSIYLAVNGAAQGYATVSPVRRQLPQARHAVCVHALRGFARARVHDAHDGRPDAGAL